jgi:hypothetical protein
MAEGPIRIANDIKQDKWISRWEGITQALLYPPTGFPPPIAAVFLHGRQPRRESTREGLHFPPLFFQFYFQLHDFTNNEKKKEIFSFLIDSPIF